MPVRWKCYAIARNQCLLEQSCTRRQCHRRPNLHRRNRVGDPAGLSSTDAVQLTAALERALGRELPPTLAFNYPTVASLVAFLAAEGAAAALQPAADPDTELLPTAVPGPQQARAVFRPTQQQAAAASLHIAIVAANLQLPGDQIASGDSAFGSDRYHSPSGQAMHAGSAQVLTSNGVALLDTCCGQACFAQALSTCRRSYLHAGIRASDAVRETQPT